MAEKECSKKEKLETRDSEFIGESVVGTHWMEKLAGCPHQAGPQPQAKQENNLWEVDQLGQMGRCAGVQRDVGLHCRCKAQITQGLCLEAPRKLFRGTSRPSSRVGTESQGCCQDWELEGPPLKKPRTTLCMIWFCGFFKAAWIKARHMAH